MSNQTFWAAFGHICTVISGRQCRSSLWQTDKSADNVGVLDTRPDFVGRQKAGQQYNVKMTTDFDDKALYKSTFTLPYLNVGVHTTDKF